MNVQSLYTLYILSVIAMLCGIFPFYCSPRLPFANASFKYRVYSIGISIVFSWLTYTSMLTFLSVTLSNDAIKGMRPVYVVYIFIVSVGFVKVIGLSIISQLNAHQFIRLITEASNLYDHISKLPKTSKEHAASKEFVRHRTCNLLSIRLSTLLVQTIVLLVSIPYVPIFLKVTLTVHMAFRIFIHFLYSIHTTLLFAALFVMWSFYVHLNQRLEICMKTSADISNNAKIRLKMQKFCDVCDDIDNITRLYEMCRVLTEKFASLFSPQILLSVIHSGGLIITQIFFMYESITKLVLVNQAAAVSVLRSVALSSYYAVEVWIVVAVAGAVTKEVCF